MTRQVVTEWKSHGDPGHPRLLSVDALYVDVDVELAEGATSAKFLIDTGADVTTLGPESSRAVFGNGYEHPTFADRYPNIPLSGVGGDGATATIHDAVLTFYTTDGGTIEKRVVLTSARPSSGRSAGMGNSSMPNLLGRDVLQHFDLRLSYHPPSVVLEEASLNG